MAGFSIEVEEDKSRKRTRICFSVSGVDLIERRSPQERRKRGSEGVGSWTSPERQVARLSRHEWSRRSPAAGRPSLSLPRMWRKRMQNLVGGCTLSNKHTQTTRQSRTWSSSARTNGKLRQEKSLHTTEEDRCVETCAEAELAVSLITAAFDV